MGVFVLLEAVFKLLDPFVLVGVLLAKKRILSSKSEVSLTKDRPTRKTDRRVVRPRRSVKPGKHDQRPFDLLFPESYDFDSACPLNTYVECTECGSEEFVIVDLDSTATRWDLDVVSYLRL